ncbi:hypothetical protein Tco_0702958 [Tanacetum coccineum]|uniref:Uncharacterized protein n=1 Tax=Tanacetum coccineum TaxID=301880 RepID=A0ABQ4XYT8_9ASTR
MPSFPSPRPTVSYSDYLDYFKDFQTEFPAIVYDDALTSKLDFLTEPTGPLIREFILEFLSTCRMCDTEMGLDVADTLCFQLGGVRHRMTWRQFILALGLHTVEEMVEDRFEAYWLGRPCEEIMPQDDILQHFWHDEGRKSGARLSGEHFIGRLAAHFGLVSDKGLRGLSVITRELLMIDLHELDAEDVLADDEGALADPTPMQAPQPPQSAPRTIPQRIARLEDEVHELWWSIVGLRGDVDRSITDQGRFATWMVSCMT